MTTRNRIVDYFLSFCAWMTVYFAPITTFILIIGFLVVCDFCTGIIAAHYRKEEILSRKMARTVYKFIAYAIGIAVAHVVSRNFFPDFPAIQLMGGFVAFIEVKSIDENIKTITGYSLFQLILDRLKSKEK